MLFVLCEAQLMYLYYLEGFRNIYIQALGSLRSFARSSVPRRRVSGIGAQLRLGVPHDAGLVPIPLTPLSPCPEAPSTLRCNQLP